MSAAAIVVAGALWLPVAAQADFGLNEFDVSFSEKDGSSARRAGSHPYSMTTFFMINHHEEESKLLVDGGDIKDLIVEQMKGFVGSATAVPRCSMIEFLPKGDSNTANCGDDTAVGATAALLQNDTDAFPAPVYNLTPPPGVPARLGFVTAKIPVVIDVGVKDSPDYNIIANTRNIPQTSYTVFGAALELWGTPADPAHDFARGKCFPDSLPANVDEIIVNGKLNLQEGGETCPANTAEKPFLTLPRACEGPLPTNYKLDPWEQPGAWVQGLSLTHDALGAPQGMGGCGKLPFEPGISSKATADSATTSTGLDFELDFEDEIDHSGEGLTEAGGIAQSDLKKAVITLPEGVTVNPSIAEGLEVCTPADLDRETISAAPGEGCPNGSKIGTVSVQTPLLGEEVKGDVFLAPQDDPSTPQPGAENPFDSLLAFYIVLKNTEQGILVKVPAKVSPDPATGQLVTTVDDAPQVPFSRFRFHFREGVRAPLITPPACGTYTTTAALTPWARPGEVITRSDSFQVTRGPGGGPCPTAATPPFHPGLIAGTTNNRAGSFSPFDLRLSRTDSEQEFTNFSIKLPPGVVGRLAGLATCSDAQVAAAEAREAPGGGRAELASPSCPPTSYVGRTLVGSGVGEALTYAPGKVYLAGPYHGAPLSFVAITAGVVGPFDIGTVVVRLALRIDPETAEVFIDATGSDPIPHIVQGIPVHLREIRVYTDRPQFVLNPTDCTPTSTASTVLGSGLDFASPADDNPLVVTSPFQAADCAALPFKPKLTFRLKGGTGRGAHPSLRAHVAMNGIGEAAIRYARVTLPRSEFLENAHIGTICTRVQFREGTVPGEKCPADSVYGHVRAVTPILEGPLEGPIYLRSSEHELPDLVAAFHHEEINVALVGRVDSVKGGGIRNTFEFVPDAPVTSADFVFDGAKKGLLVNSTDLCKGTHKVKVELRGHNGKRSDYRTPLRARCGKRQKRSKRHHRGGAGARSAR